MQPYENKADYVDDDLFKEFVAYVEESLTKMSDYFDKNDVESMRALSHKIVGSAEMFGYKELGILCKDIEVRCKTGVDFCALRTEFDSLADEIRNYNKEFLTTSG